MGSTSDPIYEFAVHSRTVSPGVYFRIKVVMRLLQNGVEIVTCEHHQSGTND